MKIIKHILMVIGALAMIGVFGWSVTDGLKKNEIKECNTWARQAKEFPKFYLTDWQKEQCDHYNIKVIDEIEVITRVGKASWYDYRLDTDDQKCNLSNGCYSQENDTCASRDYPRGTQLRIVNLDWEKLSEKDRGEQLAINCRVNDYVENPDVIIDLSSHAFRKLAPLKIGILKVEIKQVNN